MVTIIITAYNVSKTIKKAIDSCLAQTYKDLEILVVNDYSTDNTSAIVRAYNDPRVKLINNEKNVGAGMSRRIGTKAAAGEYTTFLDGDDWIEKDFIETLYSKAKEYDSDVVSCGVNIILNGKKISEEVYPEDKVLSGLESVDDAAMIKRYLNNKLVRRTIWDKVDYSDRRFIEDTLTCYFVLFFANKVVNLKYAGYNYVQNLNSLCHTSDLIKFKIYQTLCAKDICTFIMKNDKDNTIGALLTFALRMKELGLLDLPDSIQETYKDELSELLTFFYKI